MASNHRYRQPKRNFPDLPKDHDPTMKDSSNGAGVAPDAAPGDDAYNMLNSLHDNYVQLMQAPALLQPLVQRKDLVDAVEDKETLSQLMQTLDRDVKTYADKLNKIFNRHKDRTGDSTDADDRLRAIQLHEDYQQWMTSYDTVVIPTLSTIFQIFETTDAKLNEAKGEKSEEAPADATATTDTQDQTDAQP